jgi:hypothetical protein
MTMFPKLFILFLTIIILGCNGLTKTEENPNPIILATDTIAKSDTALLVKKEMASFEKQTDNLGELLNSISFNVKTDNKDFEDGIIPWVSIEKPETDIPQLIDRNKIVITETKVTIIIDYPLTNEYRFDLESKNGFTREQLLKEISKNYYKLYKEEELSATIKTLPVDKRTIMYNRNQTNGKYGIWGHDIADLDLSEILVYKTKSGRIVLSLKIES